jgi:serine-type D-Ala-D-Ala carboxypeptidase
LHGKDDLTLHKGARRTQETQVRGTLDAISLGIISEISRMNASEFYRPESSLSEDQEKRFADAFAILRQAIAERAFPGGSVAVTKIGALIALNGFGRFTYDADSPSVDLATIFDLASLTKVVATTAMAMVLYERGVIDLDAPLVGVIPEFISADSRRSEVTLRMLLTHSSGLPAHEKFFLKARDRESLLRVAFNTPLAAQPGSTSVYSDIGFIILGVALERLADEPLDRFCQREIFDSLGMTSTTFDPPKELKAQIPPTENDLHFRHRVIQGEVQDENASVLGGVAGHAGVFSTAGDLVKFAHVMLCGGSPILRSDTVELFTRRQSEPAGTSRALGWDTPSTPSQAGKYFSAWSFGHLGYTGTSLWIDPERQVSISLLTNRTWPDCSDQRIKDVRPRFHDAVIESMERSG